MLLTQIEVVLFLKKSLKELIKLVSKSLRSGRMEYARAIVNELGEVVAWCKDLTQEEIDKVLSSSTENKITCIVL